MAARRAALQEWDKPGRVLCRRRRGRRPRGRQGRARRRSGGSRGGGRGGEAHELPGRLELPVLLRQPFELEPEEPPCPAGHLCSEITRPPGDPCSLGTADRLSRPFAEVAADRPSHDGQRPAGCLPQDAAEGPAGGGPGEATDGSPGV